MVKVQVYLNQNTRESFFRGYDPGDEIKLAVEYDHPADLHDPTVLEDAFYRLNGMNPDDPIAARYYGGGNRSLSVGDLVVLDGKRAYACANLGWTKVELPQV